MNARTAQQLHEQYKDLMDREKTMRACGYVASANDLLKRALACVERRDSVTLSEALASMHLTREASHA